MSEIDKLPSGVSYSAVGCEYITQGVFKQKPHKTRYVLIS